MHFLEEKLREGQNQESLCREFTVSSAFINIPGKSR
ncbi:unnamed protein product [Tenebrio molitor]|nr:unnamed protein product [Tenebrio molitor]